ncbi:hypothetical protein AVEN_25620-1, partial [Araneus ventricosus]
MGRHHHHGKTPSPLEDTITIGRCYHHWKTPSP